jgi:hypothetical protein
VGLFISYSLFNAFLPSSLSPAPYRLIVPPPLSSPRRLSYLCTAATFASRYHHCHSLPLLLHEHSTHHRVSRPTMSSCRQALSSYHARHPCRHPRAATGPANTTPWSGRAVWPISCEPWVRALEQAATQPGPNPVHSIKDRRRIAAATNGQMLEQRTEVIPHLFLQEP